VRERANDPRASNLSRDRLAGLPRRRLRAARNVTKAVVEVVELPDGPIVVKDLVLRPWPIRLLLGPVQLDREALAYARLQNVAGVPRFLGRIDRSAIALEYVDGPDLGAIAPGRLAPAFFDDLERLLETVHGRGVAHGDLSRRDVLVDPAGRAYLVDYSTALVVGPDADPLSRFLFAQMCRADRRALAKMRRRFLPGSGVEIPERPGLYRLGSRLKRLFGRPRR